MEQDIEYFKNLETQLHKQSVRNSPDLVSELLSDDFIEFGSSGKIYDKHLTMESLEKEVSDPGITVNDFKLSRLSPEVVLVTYISSKINPQEGTTATALRSSIWKQEDNKWRLAFHQGTQIDS